MSQTTGLAAFSAKDGKSDLCIHGRGAQRLSLERLQAWERHQLGLFIHYGMSTYDGDELSPGELPASAFAPDALDPEQWVRCAAAAGARYAVLTAKHHSGFALWPTAHSP